MTAFLGSKEFFFFSFTVWRLKRIAVQWMKDASAKAVNAYLGCKQPSTPSIGLAATACCIPFSMIASMEGAMNGQLACEIICDGQGKFQK